DSGGSRERPLGEPDALVETHLARPAAADDRRDGGGEVPAEGQLGGDEIPSLLMAPVLPRPIEVVYEHPVAGAHLAAFPYERGDGGGEVLKLLDGVRAAGGLQEVASPAEAPPAVEGPVEDARQFLQQLLGEVVILVAVEAPGEPQHEESARQRRAG